jgi:alpha-glucosidase
VKSTYGITRFYTKQLLYKNHAVLSSGQLDNKALMEAAYLIYRMTQKKPALLTWLVSKKIRTSLIDVYEHTLDVPEFSTLPYSWVFPDPSRPWYERRGAGATLYYKSTLASEENILCSTQKTGSAYPPAGSTWPYYDIMRDEFGTESVFIHEFGHTIHLAIKNTDSALASRITSAYNNAKSKGLWKGTYAMTNVDEYFGETTQSWFNANKRIPEGYSLWGVHNKIWSRSSIKTYDPTMSAILDEIYGQYWLYTCP